jgi:hypothetical protein
VASLTFAPSAARVPLGVALILLAPGYACAALLFGTGITRTDRLLVSIAMSVALAAVIALVLNLTPWGLSARSWAVAAAALAIVGVAAAPEEALAVPWRGPHIGGTERILFVAAGAVAVLAIVIARTPVSANLEGYSELWIARAAPATHPITVGVRSGEIRRLDYRLVIASGGKLVLVRRFALDPGDQTELSPVLPQRLRAGPITALLYRGNSQSPYRRVRMVLTR